jgi:hypothetical protein
MYAGAVRLRLRRAKPVGPVLIQAGSAERSSAA